MRFAVHLEVLPSPGMQLPLERSHGIVQTGGEVADLVEDALRKLGKGDKFLGIPGMMVAYFQGGIYRVAPGVQLLKTRRRFMVEGDECLSIAHAVTFDGLAILEEAARRWPQLVHVFKCGPYERGDANGG